ncbi:MULTISPECIES: ATP-binding protein [Thalassotalea]|uniref:histidine kinase n=1 Tax=Thalassotalea castellviae TaxID=3075612 RepID=A0ABU3A2V4_9GAMM|nr:ATP-binding protein [Thalassotalea sp. W431]MDT0604506.1 ATP-binding protein [Thalassotalea sp. W431]
MITHFFHRYLNSLKSRIIVSALVLVMVILPIVAFFISNAYQKHMNASVENELVAYSYSILAVAEFEDGLLLMPEALAENQFNTSESGLYALMTSKGNIPRTLWRSASLLAMVIPYELQSPQVGESRFYSIPIVDINHFVYSFSVSFSDSSSEENTQQEMTLHIIKQQADYQMLMAEFRQQLWLGLFVLMAVLLLLQFIWLNWSLKPLAILKKEILGIEQGKESLLKEKYPQELKQVTEQLNTLLITEQNQRKRYRNALSDLAHSLKTPLAVLQGQLSAEDVNQSQNQLDEINAMIEHQLKRAQSAGQSSWHLGVKIAPCVEKLLNSLQKIYQDKNLFINKRMQTDIIFKGDEADFLEIIGNLMDNACKVANQQVLLTISKIESSLIISVEDDGCGIADDKIDSILQRGTRADTYAQGHGIGLAIVRDLVESYQGTLVITTSTELAGAKFTVSFSS